MRSSLIYPYLPFLLGSSARPRCRSAVHSQDSGHSVYPTPHLPVFPGELFFPTAGHTCSPLHKHPCGSWAWRNATWPCTRGHSLSMGRAQSIGYAIGTSCSSPVLGTSLEREPQRFCQRNKEGMFACKLTPFYRLLLHRNLEQWSCSYTSAPSAAVR